MTLPERPVILTVRYGQNPVEIAVERMISASEGDPLLLADMLVLLPNNRAIRAMTEAFVRKADGGLILPHMVAVGDLALDEAVAPMLDGLGSPLLPAIDQMSRLLLLAELIGNWRFVRGEKLLPAETLRLARLLCASMDELVIEEKALDGIDATDPGGDLSAHWQTSYQEMRDIIPKYREELAARGFMDATERRNFLIDALTGKIGDDARFKSIYAIGISTAVPAVARLMARLAKLPQATIILPTVDFEMADEDWLDLGSQDPGDGEFAAKYPKEMHPQYQLKLLLERMNVNRSELQWADSECDPVRHGQITNIFCAASKTAEWRQLSKAQKTMSGLSLFEAEDNAGEALGVAIKIRQELEHPFKRIAVITPDRELGLRISQQLKRWGIGVDDSAGIPAVTTPHGAMLFAALACLQSNFSATNLLALWKHPFVQAGEARLDWLENVRAIDMLLRGPPVGVGLKAISQKIKSEAQFARGQGRIERVTELESLALWYAEQCKPLETFAQAASKNVASLIDALSELLDLLSGGTYWKGATGRQFAQFLEEMSSRDLGFMGQQPFAAIPQIFREFLADMAIRPAYGAHPRVAIYGLLEARLQSADVVICAGLNEDSWPQNSAPDPWLAPAIRRTLGLASIERNIGLAAHDLASALGAKEVLLTRAKRNRSGPAIASRFLLRLQAFLGGNLRQDDVLSAYVAAIDMTEDKPVPATRPAMEPTLGQRQSAILSVTDFDKLKSDPYSIYASKILRLRNQNPVDAEPDAAWRGSIIHGVLDDWAKKDGYKPEKLVARAEAMLRSDNIHPSLRAFWLPRISKALEWIAGEIAQNRTEDRNPIASELSGIVELGGVNIKGRVDRIDRVGTDGLAIVDYKTGKSPSHAEISGGFKLQLGLLALIAEQGGFEHIAGTARRFEYWSLSRKKDHFGTIEHAAKQGRNKSQIEPEDFVAHCRNHALALIEEYIIGEAPFVAKAHPDFAGYADYDQLMRFAEWDGRSPPGEAP